MKSLEFVEMKECVGVNSDGQKFAYIAATLTDADGVKYLIPIEQDDYLEMGTTVVEWSDVQ